MGRDAPPLTLTEREAPSSSVKYRHRTLVRPGGRAVHPPNHDCLSPDAPGGPRRPGRPEATGDAGSPASPREEAGSPEDPRWTVGELAERAGVTVRTLHHYDELGLVPPRERTRAGYRI